MNQAPGIQETVSLLLSYAHALKDLITQVEVHDADEGLVGLDRSPSSHVFVA